jgi:hypothetical protein
VEALPKLTLPLQFTVPLKLDTPEVVLKLQAPLNVFVPPLAVKLPTTESVLFNVAGP